MSKDNISNNLRLLGSPVNLSYRGKNNDDKKVRNRPRSALQNSGFVQDHPERHRRPFSADGKDRGQSIRSFMNTFHDDLLKSVPYPPNNIKVVPPTTELLGDKYHSHPPADKDMCSNASDYGSEDTFISLGTKIKARAQSPKGKRTKNIVKYRNPTKKGKKTTDKNTNEQILNSFGVEVKVIEREKGRNNIFTERCNSPFHSTGPYASYFLSLDDNKIGESSLAGRVSFGADTLNCDVQNSIDTYTHRLSLTKQQLSLVEEECTQDLESVQSQNVSSLSPENSFEDPRVNTPFENSDIVDKSHTPDRDTKPIQNVVSDARTYSSFYDDLNAKINNSKTKSMCRCDTASKDSGYPDSGTNEEHGFNRESRSRKNFPKKSNVREGIEFRQSQSLHCTPSPVFDSDTASEPVNHSRLLYKDFFLKKEGHVAVPPQNSPNKSDGDLSGPRNTSPKNVDKFENIEYPSYLLNSETKAYTSKVIEDYKKEIAAINNLHELTIKDISVDTAPAAHIDIDKLFEPPSVAHDPQKGIVNDHKSDTNKAPETTEIVKLEVKKDVSDISTSELIQNYLKVKEGDYTKNFKKCDKKNINQTSDATTSYKPWNSKTGAKSMRSSVVNKPQSQKNIFTMKAPLSARIEGVNNDKDIESWISLTETSPRITDADNILDSKHVDPDDKEVQHDIKPESIVEEIETNIETSASLLDEMEPAKTKDLNSNATVLDIYSMLKEIESFGDNPVPVDNQEGKEDKLEQSKEERPVTPKDQYMEIFQFLEKVEQSANDALSVVTTTTPQTIPKLESLLKLPQTELAQRLVTASLQLEERSCCIALLQESLTNHKEQMLNKVTNLERQSSRTVSRVKHECEEAIKRHQTFIDQLINDKKTLNHRIEQLVDERRSLEEKWRRAAAALEERYKLEMRNQRDKMAAAQQVARQRWVRQKAEKIKELTIKGLEGELREMADRQQKEITDLKMSHAEQLGKSQAKHSVELEELRRVLDEEKEAALLKERQLASARLEKQMVELESTYREQRSRLVAELRADSDRAAARLQTTEAAKMAEIESWRIQQEKLIEEKRQEMEKEMAERKQKIQEEMAVVRLELESEFAAYRQKFEAEQSQILKRKVTEITTQHKIERDKEIEKAIESMEAEAAQGRKEMQEALRRTKEQYESELAALGETEQATLRRYQEAQARVRQTEDRCAELEVAVNQLETRNKVLTEKTMELEREMESLSEKTASSWRVKLQAVEEQAAAAARSHDEHMQQLYAKVKVAVARKDSAIQALTHEAAKHQEKVAVLEQKLQQQRKDFLKHK